MKYTLLLIAFLFGLTLQSKAQYGEGRYTFVFLNTNPERAELPKAQVDSLQAGHMANIGRLIKERKMIAAGPFYTGGGIFLFDTNLEETQALLDSDPAIAAGRYRLEVYPFDLIEGRICTLWDKDEAEVEMTSYFFVRYMPNKTDEDLASVKTNRFTENVLRDIRQGMQDKAQIIGAINLNSNKGQVIIYKSDQEGGFEEAFADHELVKQGFMKYYQKQIYFAKGVFCEN